MTPIRISKRSVSVVTTLFLILALGICILPATPANAYDEYLPRMDVQQKPVDGDPDTPGDIESGSIAAPEMDGWAGLRLLIDVLLKTPLVL